jgi:hypothetical protein
VETYLVRHDYPNATKPGPKWWAQTWNLRGERPCDDTKHVPGAELYIPPLDAWLPDTLYMVLHEISAYLPPDPHAVAGVKAALRKPRGRQPKVPRPPTMDDRCELYVEAQGWRAYVRTEADMKRADGKPTPPLGEWSEPMQALLLDMAARSPFPLSTIPLVRCAPTTDDAEHGAKLRPSRYDVVHGDERPFRPQLGLVETVVDAIRRWLEEHEE